MKIAVYTITKNEEQFIQRWADSCKDADYRVIVDTGSTDGTVEAARAAGCIVHEIKVNPWRFDVARNSSLSLVPGDADLCIALDADEVLIEGWRQHPESLPTEVTRPRYEYTWSWNADGSPGLVYYGDKIHSRSGYIWTHPVHEVLKPVAGELQANCGLKIHHFPDSTKSRAQYLPLLELSVQEDPNDDRNLHYLGREYFYLGMTEQAIPVLLRHLEVSHWPPERAKTMRMLAKLIPESEEAWLLKAAAEDQSRRETWLDLADFHRVRSNWNLVLAYALRALDIKERDALYLNEAEAWGARPYDLAALASFYLEDKASALIYGSMAAATEPWDERLANNLKWYQGVVESSE
jgi:hypothetical protein